MQAKLTIIIVGVLASCSKPAADDQTLADPPTIPIEREPLTPSPRPEPQRFKPVVESDEGVAGGDYYRRAVLLLNEQRNAEAVAQLDKCVAVDLHAAMCHRALGIAHARLHHGREAAEAYKMYIVLAPNSSDAEQARRFVAEFERPE